MLYLVTKLSQLEFSKLMMVYESTNQRNGSLLSPDAPKNLQLLQAEQAFYQYLGEIFFRIPGAVYAIWQENQHYIGALRLEPYQGGLLLTALETAPSFRQQGYATKLIRAVQNEFSQPIYSHVEKRNIASIGVHKKCGFRIHADYAHYIDGTVARNAVTFCYP